jgi:hypothetical protein
MPGSTCAKPQGSARIATFVSAARALAMRIDEVGGAFPWRWRIVVVGDAARYVPIGQILESVGANQLGCRKLKLYRRRFGRRARKAPSRLASARKSGGHRANDQPHRVAARDRRRRSTPLFRIGWKASWKEARAKRCRSSDEDAGQLEFQQRCPEVETICGGAVCHGSVPRRRRG